MNFLRRANLPIAPTSGGFHGWSYGDWDGNYFDVFNPQQVVTPQSLGDQNRFMFCGPSTSAVDDIVTQHPTQTWRCRGSDSYIAAGRQKPSRAAASDGRLVALRSSKTANTSLDLSIGGLAGAGVGWGNTLATTLDLIDMNGDGYPDSVGGDTVRYNLAATGTHGFGPAQGVSSASIREVRHRNVQANASDGGYVLNVVSGSGQSKGIVPTSFGVGVDYSASAVTRDLIDINGDGLPDRVRKSPSDSAVFVQLNLGYSFGTEIPWTVPSWGLGYADVGFLSALNSIPGFSGDVSPETLSLQDTTSNSGGISVGGIGGGDVLTTSRTAVEVVDMNGDRLPDLVMKRPNESGKVRVKINLGTRFAAAETWTIPAGWKNVDFNPTASWTYPTAYQFALDPDAVSYQRSEGWQGSVGFEFCFLLCLGASGFTSRQSGSAELQFTDIDGDGAADRVLKVDGNDMVMAKRNTTKIANLLKQVKRPLGGTIALQYQQTGGVVSGPASDPARIDMQGVRWVLSRVAVDDGRGNSYSSNITYDRLGVPGLEPVLPSGFYDCVERQDYGFGHVRIVRGERVNGTGPFVNGDGSSVDRFYLNHSYWHRGLMASEYDLDPDWARPS